MLIPRVEQLITEIAEKLDWNWNQTKNRFWISREIKSCSAVFFKKTSRIIIRYITSDAVCWKSCHELRCICSRTFWTRDRRRHLKFWKGAMRQRLWQSDPVCLCMGPTHIHTHTRTQRLSSPTLLYKRFHDQVAGAIVCCYKKNLTGAVLFSWRFPFRTDGWNGFSMR
jgi:hypothetical protein